MESIQPPIRSITMASSLRVKRPVHEADHLGQFDAGLRMIMAVSPQRALEHLDIYV